MCLNILKIRIEQFTDSSDLAQITADEWRDGGNPNIPIDQAKKKSSLERAIECPPDPDYKPEVFVTHKREVGGWEVTVAGRIDGLTVREDEKRIVVEEVKSLHFELELAALLRSDKLHRHLFQLLLYSHFLSTREEYAGYTFAPQLALIDLVTGSTRMIDAEFDQDTIEATFLRALRRLVDGLESERALRLAKSAWAEEIEFPFGVMRPFQEEMVDAVARSVRQRERLICHSEQ